MFTLLHLLLQPSPFPSVPKDPISPLSSISPIVLFSLQFPHSKTFSQWDCKRGWSSKQETASPSYCVDVKIKNNHKPARFKHTRNTFLVRAGVLPAPVWLQEESTHLLPTICPLCPPNMHIVMLNVPISLWICHHKCLIPAWANWCNLDLPLFLGQGAESVCAVLSLN